MAAAVSIAPIKANSPDLPGAMTKPPAEPTAKTEAPLTPSNEALEFDPQDLGFLIGPEARRGQPNDESTTSTQAEGPAADRVVRLPMPSPLPYSFELRQQWEGVVTRIARDEFAVVLRDLTTPGSPELEAVLPLEEVSADDLPLLAKGAVLYWTIGYEHTLTGQRKRVSIIRLRRLPAWTRKDLSRVEQRAAELDDLFKG